MTVMNPTMTYITGFMKSGKSAELIKRIEEVKFGTYRSLIIKPLVDTRDGHFVTTRKHNRKHPAVMLDEKNPQMVDLVLMSIEFYGYVFIDEVQFFSKEFIQKVSDRCYTYGADLIASGLMKDFKGNYFPSSFYLEAYSDEVVKVDGKCDFCGELADKDVLVKHDHNTHRTTLVTDGDSTVIEGSNDSLEFLTVCNKCYTTLFTKVDND